jgi:polar amino acid transport system substrate-binding protein
MLNRNIYKIFMICVFLIIPFQLSYAESPSRVSVGVFECPPFVMKMDNNSYSGISIELWEYIAKQMDLEYSIESFTLKDMLESVKSGQIDIGASCTSITSNRERFLDFSHSFYETHLAIAIKEQGHLAILINLLTNKIVLTFFLFFIVGAFIVGGIYYLLEGDSNSKIFSMSSPAKRLTEIFILGLLFVTKGPFQYFHLKSLTARVLTVFMAIATTFIIAGITAFLASSFTLGMLRSDIQGPNDLYGKKVGVISGSTSSSFLKKQSVHRVTFKNKEDLLNALDNERVEAIVSDAAILKYMIKKGRENDRYTKLSVLPYRFEEQNYGFALQDNSPYREQLNQVLLKIRKTDDWKYVLDKYFDRN